MAHIEIRMITFFASKDGGAYTVSKKQDKERIVAQIMNSILPNSDLS